MQQEHNKVNFPFGFLNAFQSVGLFYFLFCFLGWFLWFPPLFYFLFCFLLFYFAVSKRCVYPYDYMVMMTRLNYLCRMRSLANCLVVLV